MSSDYTKIASNNILPLSISGELTEAFREWYYTGDMYDHEVADQVCYLCNKDDLRYHFKINNKHTGHSLWVGSICILKFEVPVYEDGQELTHEDAEKKLQADKERMRLESCIRALKRVAQKEESGVQDILNNALEYYRKEKALTPKYAAVVFWKLNEHNIDYSPSFFSIRLRKDKHKEALRNMPTWKVHTFWPALTSQQKKKSQEMGHEPPAKARENA